MRGFFKSCRSYFTKISQTITKGYRVAAMFLENLNNPLRFRLFLNGYLSFKEMLVLSDVQLEIIVDPYILKLIRSNKITRQQAIQLNYYTFTSLSNSYSFIRRNIDSGNITAQQVIKLDDYQIDLLSVRRCLSVPPDPTISNLYTLICAGKYDIRDIINLSHQNFKKIEQAYSIFPDLFSLDLTVHEVLNLTTEQIDKLKTLRMLKDSDSDFYDSLVSKYDKKIFLHLLIFKIPNTQIETLNIFKIQCLITSSKLSVELALKLTAQQIEILCTHSIYTLIMDYKRQIIQVEQILKLTPREIEILTTRFIYYLLMRRKNSQLDFSTALNLNDIQRETLNLELIFKLIEDNKLKLQDALELNLTPEQRTTLIGLTPLIQGDKIELREALQLTPAAQQALTSDSIQQLIINNRILLTQVLDLVENNEQAIRNLSHPIIFDLIMSGRLSVLNATLLTAVELTELIERRRIRRNVLPIFDHYHGAQNTHTASIHKSASISAGKLAKWYSVINIQQILTTIKEWSLGLSDNSVSVCVEKISHDDSIGSHRDPFSGISIRELLMLAWCAIHDDHKRIGSVEDALKLLADGLSEIANGYGPGRFICCGGAFNKIIEKLVGVIDGVELKVVTMEQASSRMNALIKDAAKDYVARLPEGLSKTELIEKLKLEGISIIWDKVSAQIQKELIKEFDELFDSDINDHKFKELLSAKDDVDLTACFNDDEPLLTAPVRMSCIPT